MNDIQIVKRSITSDEKFGFIERPNEVYGAGMMINLNMNSDLWG